MKKKLIDKYLELDKHIVKNVLYESFSIKEFWKKLNVGAPLRTNRGVNEWKQFEDYFGIQIRKTINNNIKNRKNQLFQIELNKDRICKNPKCKKHFTWKQHPNSEFCSKSCSTSYSAQHVNPDNIKKGINKSNQVLKQLACKHCGKLVYVKMCASSVICEECLLQNKNYSNVCQICGKQLNTRQRRKTCCKKHAKLLRVQSYRVKQSKFHRCGGKRSHSGRGKQGRYHGIWCDSSWELAWVIYQEEHQVKFKKYHGYFEYIFEGKKHKYYPDFELEDGTIVEIKGYWSKQWQTKLDQLPKDKHLQILSQNEMIPILKYVKEKYGDNFISLYE